MYRGTSTRCDQRGMGAFTRLIPKDSCSFCGNDPGGLIELEGQYRFGRHPDGRALCEYLCKRSRAGAGSRTDRRALSAARDSTDDRAQGSTSSGVLAGASIYPNARGSALLQVACAYQVLLTFHRNGLQVQHEIRSAPEAASLGSGADDNLRV